MNTRNQLRNELNRGSGQAQEAAPPHRARGMRGTALIFVTVAITTCIAFSVLTLDIGMILMTRIQLQNAADAAALAGVSALMAGGTQAAARTRAIAVAGQNVAWRDGLDAVIIDDPDVTFPSATRCRVQTHRTRATGDALRTFFIRVLDPGADLLAEASAAAEAEFFLVCGTSCVKPWSVPDRWDDTNDNGEYDYAEPYTDSNGNDQWNPGEPFEDQNGNGAWDPDEPYDPVTSGYLPPGDVGLRITLKIGDPNDAIVPGFFYAVDLPPMHDPAGDPETGADVYREHIATCAPYVINLGDSLQVEPGNMVGPTRQGVLDLIAQDPGASWDDASQSVVGSAYGTSPRVVKIAFFDPRFTPKSGRNFVIVSKLGGFFLEGVGGQSAVTGVFMGLTTPGEPCEGGEPSFLLSLHLVE